MLSATISVVLILIDDSVLRRHNLPFVLNALTDEPAHAATALLAVAAVYSVLRKQWNCGILVATLLGGTLIDVDHLPAVAGCDIITSGTHRPYSHSLFTLGVLVIIVVCTAGPRRELWGVASLALASHFARDLVDGSAVPLFWPLSKHGVTIPYILYAAALILCLGTIFAFRTVGRSAANTDASLDASRMSE